MAGEARRHLTRVDVRLETGAAQHGLDREHVGTDCTRLEGRDELVDSGHGVARRVAVTVDALVPHDRTSMPPKPPRSSTDRHVDSWSGRPGERSASISVAPWPHEAGERLHTTTRPSGASRGTDEVDEREELAGRQAFNARAQHHRREVAGRDRSQVVRDVVDTHLEPASERPVGRLEAGLDPVRVDPGVDQRVDEIAGARLADGDASAGGTEHVDHDVLPDRVVALGNDVCDLVRVRGREPGAALELLDPAAQEEQRLPHRDAHFRDLFRDPRVIPAEEPRFRLLHLRERPLVRRGRDQRVDRNCFLDAVERGVEVGRGAHRREAREHCVEVALEIRRIRAVGASCTRFGLDLASYSYEVDRCVGHGSGGYIPPTTSIAAVSRRGIIVLGLAALCFFGYAWSVQAGRPTLAAVVPRVDPRDRSAARGSVTRSRIRRAAEADRLVRGCGRSAQLRARSARLGAW